jgi:hypothetical protein
LARKANLICGPASRSNEELISSLQHESHNQQIGTLIDHNDIVEMLHGPIYIETEKEEP